MTVEAQNLDGTPVVRSGPYLGNGVTTVFDYDFPITEETEVRVTRQNADLTEDVLELVTDYTVSGVGNPGGGSITLVNPALLPTGAKLVAQINMAFDQSTAYSNQGRIQLEPLETSLDKVTLMCRQLREELQRAVTVDAFNTTNIAQLRANIDALAAIETDLAALAANLADIGTVAGAAADVSAVAAIAAAVSTNAANIVAIQNASANAIAAANSAAAASSDASATAADRVQTGLDASATAADRVQTGLDRVQTGLDRVQTGADRVQTGLDVVAAAASAVEAATFDPALYIPKGLLTTRGDVIRRGASAPERLALGTDGQMIGSNGTDLVNLPGAWEYGWHGYQQTERGVLNDGQITLGAFPLTEIITPDFENGFEYRLRLTGISHNSGSNQTLRIELFRSTDGVYGSPLTISQSATAANTVAAELYLETVRITSSIHVVSGVSTIYSAGAPTPLPINVICAQSAQKRTRARLSWSAGSFDNGSVRLLRRRVDFHSSS
jgi:hypothetical protein